MEHPDLKKVSYKTKLAPLQPEHEISDPSGRRATVIPQRQIGFGIARSLVIATKVAHQTAISWYRNSVSMPVIMW